MKLSQTSTRCRGRGAEGGGLIRGTKNQVAKWGPEGRSPHSHTRNPKNPGPVRHSPGRPRVSLPPGKPARRGGHARPGRFPPPGAGKWLPPARPAAHSRPRRIPEAPQEQAELAPAAFSPAAPHPASPARAHLLDVVEAREHADAPVVEDGELLRQLLLTGLQHGARHGAAAAAAGRATPRLAASLWPARLPATSASTRRAHAVRPPAP